MHIGISAEGRGGYEQVGKCKRPKPVIDSVFSVEPAACASLVFHPIQRV